MATLTSFSRLALPPVANPNKSPNLTFTFPRPRFLNFPNSTNSKSAPHWRISSTNQFLLLETANAPQELVAASDAPSTVVSALLFLAFVGLAVLTVGVIYIAVTDFLQKREGDRFEKEEAAAAKKKRKIRGRKGVAAGRARGGPRGFGQKLKEDDGDE